MYTHAYSGLETMIFTFLLCLSLFLLLERAKIEHEIIDWILPLVVLLICLTRPEGAAWAFCLILGSRIWIGHQSKDEISFWLKPFLLFFVPGALYFLWRWGYYGKLLPNTFYVKHYSEGINLDSAKEIVKYGLYYGLVPIGVCCFVAIRRFISPKLPVSKELRIIGSICLGFILISTIVYIQSSLYMNYSYRFFIPWLPLGLVIIGMGVKESLGEASAKYGKQAVYLLFFFQIALQLSFFPKEISWAVEYQAIMEKEWKPCAKFIDTWLPLSETLIVYQDAGYVPWYTGQRTIDFGRLNDEVLTQPEMTEAKIVDYFFAYQAGAVVITSFDQETYAYHDEGMAIYNDPRFAQNYVLIAKFSAGAEINYHQWLFFRKDLEHIIRQAKSSKSIAQITDKDRYPMLSDKK